MLLLSALVLGLLLAGAAPGPSAATATRPAAAPATPDRPNVVVVMADDMRYDDVLFMPRTRRLFARQGITFRNGFSPNPLCCPARVSFLTGRYSHNHHVMSHVHPWGFKSFDDRFTLFTAMNQAGYKTAHVGKYINGYGRQTSRVTGGPSLRYVPRGYTDWYASIESPPGSGYGGTYNYFDVTYNHNGRIDDGHRGEYSTLGIGRISRRLISAYAKGDRPFFLLSSFVAPHHGDPDEADDPHYPTPARPSWVRGRFDDVITRAPGVPRGGGRIEADVTDKPGYIAVRPDPVQRRRDAMRDGARQRAESLYVLDLEVRRIVRTLRKSGEWENTVLFFLSDNGYFIGEHRILDGKLYPYEPAIRVPFMATGPGLRTGEKRFDPITIPDLTATILDLGNATGRMTRHWPLDGSSKLPMMLGGDRGWTSPVVTEGFIWPRYDRDEARRRGFTGSGRSYIGIRTPRYSYVRYIRGQVEELYDLSIDANQMRSRHDVDGYRPVKRQLLEVWNQFKDCRGNACLAPLPEELQADPAAEKKLTVSFYRQLEAEHGY